MVIYSFTLILDGFYVCKGVQPHNNANKMKPRIDWLCDCDKCGRVFGGVVGVCYSMDGQMIVHVRL